MFTSDWDGWRLGWLTPNTGQAWLKQAWPEPSDASHTSTFFTLAGSDQTFPDQLNHTSQKEQNHPSGLLVNSVKINSSSTVGLPAALRLLTAEALLAPGGPEGLFC